ncbi:hypothetical protein [Pararhizobium sp.]|uniref:hypothetical protein n=1 Tax=Pararhizobium sp. TaxID=1977563 RepID=UPI003D0EDD88
MQTQQSWTIDDITVTRMPSAHHRVWVTIGSEADIKHLMKTWDGVYRFQIQDIPENSDVYWCLTNVLFHSQRRDTIRINNGAVQVDRRRLKELRDGVDWFFDLLAEEHHPDRYEWFDHIKDWVRCDDAPQPLTELEDARRCIVTIDAIFEVTADNVIRLSDREIA